MNSDTEHERLALLKEIECGLRVVVPTSIEHAEFMIRVAQFYIDQQHQETLRILKNEYRNT